MLKREALKEKVLKWKALTKLRAEKGRAEKESAGKESAEKGRAKNESAEAGIIGRSSEGLGKKARPQDLELPRFDPAAGLEVPTHLREPAQTSVQECSSQVRQVAPLNQSLTQSPNLEPQTTEEPPSTPTIPIHRACDQSML